MGLDKNMRQIIDNILYDTETAEKIPKGWISRADLYKTKNNRWFMVNVEHFTNLSITIIKEKEVKDWLGRTNIGLYKKHFGEPEEG